MKIRRILEKGATVRDKDLQHVFKMYQLLQTGVSVGLDELTLTQVDGLRLIQQETNRIRERQQKEMERKARMQRGRM